MQGGSFTSGLHPPKMNSILKITSFHSIFGVCESSWEAFFFFFFERVLIYLLQWFAKTGQSWEVCELVVSQDLALCILYDCHRAGLFVDISYLWRWSLKHSQIILMQESHYYGCTIRFWDMFNLLFLGSKICIYVCVAIIIQDTSNVLSCCDIVYFIDKIWCWWAFLKLWILTHFHTCVSVRIWSDCEAVQNKWTCTSAA